MCGFFVFWFQLKLHIIKLLLHLTLMGCKQIDMCSQTLDFFLLGFIFFDELVVFCHETLLFEANLYPFVFRNLEFLHFVGIFRIVVYVKWDRCHDIFSRNNNQLCIFLRWQNGVNLESFAKYDDVGIVLSHIQYLGFQIFCASLKYDLEFLVFTAVV